ncbi:MAG: hypothetical protein Kow00127_20710 [Bacteroidales bacterium]
MKIIVPLFLVLMILGTSCRQQDNASPPVDINKEKKEVALVLEKYIIANEKQDLDLVREVWAPEPDIVVFGTNSDEKLIGWKAIEEALAKQFSSIEETYITVRDQVVNVDSDGNTAWFAEIMNYNYIYQGKPVQFEGLRFTGVLQKRDGKWYIVQSHISIPGTPD